MPLHWRARPGWRLPAPHDNLYPKLLAVLVAHGSNLGIATMAQSMEGMTVDQLDHVSQRYLRPETLEAANKIVVDFQPVPPPRRPRYHHPT